MGKPMDSCAGSTRRKNVRPRSRRHDGGRGDYQVGRRSRVSRRRQTFQSLQLLFGAGPIGNGCGAVAVPDEFKAAG